MKDWVPEKLLEQIKQYEMEHKKIVLTDKRNWIDNYAIPVLNHYTDMEICIDDEVGHVTIKITAGSFAISEDDDIRVVIEIADAIFIKSVAEKVEIILWFRCWDYV